MDAITHVSALSMAGMGVSMLLSLAAVIAAFVYGRKRFRAPVSSFFVGVGVFILFALVLESLLHNLLLTTPVGQKIFGNMWLYALYGGAAAAIFEETGRIFAAKTFLRRQNDVPNAYMYGAGHGGIEAIFVGVISQISNLSLDAILVLINRSFGLIPAEAFCTVFVLLVVLLTAKLAPLPPREEEAA